MSVDKWKVGDGSVMPEHVEELREILGILDLTWSNIADKPATMPASIHTHTFDSLDNLPTEFTPVAHTHNWGEINNKPTTFAPANHSHSWSDLEDVPTSFPPATHSHAWEAITNKPSTFNPATHTHVWADITDKPATFAPSAHSHSWSSVTDKPTTFAPSAHTHSIADVTQLQAELDKRTTKRVEIYTGTTNSSGDITLSFSPAFSAAPIVIPETPTSSNQMWVKVSATTTSATYRLVQRSAVSLLAVEVLLAATAAVSGAAGKFLVIGER